MDRENALSTIASFDTELYTFFQEEVQRQKYTLSSKPVGLASSWCFVNVFDKILPSRYVLKGDE